MSNKKTAGKAANDQDVISVIESNIYDQVNNYINNLKNPDDIYDNNGLFVGMLKYIYKYYLCDVLKNNKSDHNNRYDYQLLDEIFTIYTQLVYEYKKNKQPYINEFCIFLNINRETIYQIKYGNVKKASINDIQNVKRWFFECEQGLLNTDTVGSIFRLKSMFNYNDNLAAVPIEYQEHMLSINQLPDLSQNDPKKALPDKQENPANLDK